MERSESNQLEAGPILCRTGCGFFGSPNTDGLCSKCHKDQLKKKQQPPSQSSPPNTSPVSTPAQSTQLSTAQPTVPSITQPSSEDLTSSSSPVSSSVASASSPLPSGAEAAPSTAAQDIDNDSSSSSDKDGAKKKKNKCQSCKKKVGLTGFTCRCGGLFCSVHRYSNEHRCTFDYRELGAEEIRRNNPVIKGEKIQKI